MFPDDLLTPAMAGIRSALLTGLILVVVLVLRKLIMDALSRTDRRR